MQQIQVPRNLIFFALQSDFGLCHALGMASDAKSKINPAAVALGRLGGLKGGSARTANMTPVQRKAAEHLQDNTIRTCWVPGVNNLGKFGRWAFAEFTGVFEIDHDFDKLVKSFVATKP
jgi:hypothetical protein